jgi:hypothetical protein
MGPRSRPLAVPALVGILLAVAGCTGTIQNNGSSAGLGGDAAVAREAGGSGGDGGAPGRTDGGVPGGGDGGAPSGGDGGAPSGGDGGARGDAGPWPCGEVPRASAPPLTVPTGGRSSRTT